MPANVSATDTSAAWDAAKQKLVVSGTIYEPDGKTPAPNIVLYYWQTNENGAYANSKELAPAARRHGYIRGWVKTDQNGQYTVYTTRPGSYPNGRNPAHIHLLIKEPDIPNEYYIDDVLFEDDPLLTEEVKNQLENKGGNGVSKVWQEKDVQKVKRDVILGKNIENYPSKK
ncbi:intradiol ring-cleavage dioxygenase [Pontibacter locisalis]|uniref:Intradiol ring-cleavage dioxygenase n=1 Tax=Pontibacter locisalis TaxID=1719035 RepID=A0ABW5ILY6_9BACT